MSKKIVIKLIKVYQNYLSPLLGYHCRFYPTCSNYTIGAIEKYGFLKGSYRGLLRIMKCQPFYRGGVDLP